MADEHCEWWCHFCCYGRQWQFFFEEKEFKHCVGHFVSRSGCVSSIIDSQNPMKHSIPTKDTFLAQNTPPFKFHHGFMVALVMGSWFFISLTNYVDSSLNNAHKNIVMIIIIIINI